MLKNFSLKNCLFVSISSSFILMFQIREFLSLQRQSAATPIKRPRDATGSKSNFFDKYYFLQIQKNKEFLVITKYILSNFFKKILFYCLWPFKHFDKELEV